MYHHNEIARALRMLVQGASLLTQDSDGSDGVQVVSSRLFAPDTQVRLVDNSGQVENHVVAEQVSGTEVRLEAGVEGSFTVAAGSRLQLGEGTAAKLKWVAQGPPELMPTPRSLQLPAMVVEPSTMSQPPNAGTNRTYEQEYLFNLYYVRKAVEGEEANVELLEEVGDLFNLVMGDPYLEDTCWHAQVTKVEPQPEVETVLRAKNPGLQVVKLEVLAKRSEVWTG